MCGICGIFHYGEFSRPCEPKLVEAMNATLAHRGPDDSGVHIDGPVGLGQRRLSIIDTSPAGHQPMLNEDGSIALVYNGEFYGYAEKRAELQREGVHFRSSTDTEVVLRLYERYGKDFLAHVDGMFALAIWDRNASRLLLARDRIGIKPLYYHDNGKRIAFASELKGLLPLEDIPRKINASALRNYLRFMCIPGPESIFQGVGKLPAGHLLEVGATGRHVRRYWDVEDLRPRRGLSLDQASEEFTHLFSRSVKQHMVADVPVGSFLSGGVDSSAISALAAGHAADRLNTFSISFPGHPEHDESYYARQVAQRYGTRHHELSLCPDVTALLPRMVRHADEPFAISSAFALFALAELASEHVKVVLSGDGADEVFAGYEHRYTPLPARYPAMFRRLCHLPGRLGRSMTWGTRRPSQDFGNRFQRFKDSQVDVLLTDGLRAELDAMESSNPVSRQFDHPRRATQLGRMLYADLKVTLEAEMLTKVDRMTMAHGLEARVPFLDHRLVEWAFTLPDEVRFQNGVGKRVVKQAMEPYLSHDLLYRPKHGFNVPLADWLRNDLKAWATDLLAPSRLERLGLFRVETVHRLLREHLQGRADHGNQLFMLLAFTLWEDQFMAHGSQGAHA